MKYVLLAFLADMPAHGYRLKQLIDGLLLGVSSEVNVGQIYSTLQRLERDAFIARKAVAGTSPGRSKTVFAITGEGREELISWFKTPISIAPVNADLGLKVLMANLTKLEEVENVIAAQRTEYLGALSSLDELIRVGADGDSNQLLAESAALHVEADLKWLEQASIQLGGSN